ncbi:MAG: hypothetical protein ACYC4R_06415 [Anaerolineae bacterium]
MTATEKPTRRIEVDPPGRAILDRHAAWWKRQGTLVARIPTAPLGTLWLPLSDGSTAGEDRDITPDMLDLDRLAGEPMQPGPLEFVGDWVRSREPYVRIPWVEAILGCPIHTTLLGGSMRGRAYISDWCQWRPSVPYLRTEWLEALERSVDLLEARSGGRYAVVQTLMRGPSDLAEAVLGPELMALSMYDAPDELRGFLDAVTDVFLQVLEAQRCRTTPVLGGYVSYFGIWAPGTVVRTQCDASAILSPRQYAAWYLPYDERISQASAYSIIHLHSGSLHTVPALVEHAYPQAIQVSLDPEPSGPPLRALLPAFRAVLAHKPLLVDGDMSEADIALLRDELPGDGLAIWARVS